MIDLKGARVGVTGGGRGIGRATAAALAACGAIVTIGDIDLDVAVSTAEDIGVHAHHLDVTDEASFRDFLIAAASGGDIDMLVNNAGVQLMGRFVENSLDALHRELAINLGAVVTGTRLVLPDMIARGRGHIVNVSSMAGKVSTPGMATYCASKFGVVALSRAIRAELAGTGVSLTTVMPAATRTDLTSGVTLRLQPTLEPADVAEAIVASARHGRSEMTVPRWLAPMGLVEQGVPEGLLLGAKRLVGGKEPGAFDPGRRKAYLERTQTP
ncbi:SDR family NAD(P)-dependent oxidoreductase [Rhodococcus erythropolis]|uniref:SDR family NAD(P)-dependent oxidoreductase n=1 Tax=Rhodococcus erythropolis TaxID=1833 RepID=UPI0024BAA1B4|nr:SDR family NAD(P)-dependent oxidoreductase [Rhodococcus erythropolis]MDJ0404224.1 SDR family NAD(P)-dependent oxidoreductase [Rhodococcus erythropolis]